jgi:hypothetical protein
VKQIKSIPDCILKVSIKNALHSQQPQEWKFTEGEPMDPPRHIRSQVSFFWFSIS